MDALQAAQRSGPVCPLFSSMLPLMPGRPSRCASWLLTGESTTGVCETEFGQRRPGTACACRQSVSAGHVMT